MQQRFRRDAADIEANAAEHRPAFDQHHAFAEVGGAKSGRIAAGSGAKHQHFGMGIGPRRRPPSRRRVGIDRSRNGRRRRFCLPGLQAQDQVALRDMVTLLDPNLGDHAGGRRRHLHARLVGFERDQRVFGLDRGAGGDMDLDDLDVLEVADVGDLDVDRIVDAARGPVVRRARSRRRRRLALHPLLGRDRGRTRRLEHENEIALRHAVADLHPDVAHRAGLRRRHFHARLVGFERDQRVIGADARARSDVHLDDRHALEIADIRNPDLDRAHAVPPQSTRRRTSSSR